MKKLTGALVLSFSLLLAAGCRSAGETKAAEDASTPSQDASTGDLGTSQGGLTGEPAGGTPGGAAQPTPGGATQPGTEPGVAPGGSTAGQGPEAGTGSPTAGLSEEARAAQEQCLNTWLQSKNMDQYGHPEGTMYAGGSPLFNEQTGEMKDRLDYVYQRQPEAKKACASIGSTGTKPPAPKK